ncbi:Heparanase [Lasius niger]|uniref:Heparanase n=1 Tax=Lasius niger TaxID=67767 RepID=A0A0J7K9H1_LASNI|nr:Heparanase [Lasius niger]
MRQPSNIYEATPDYWVSLLHKTLVGRQVLEMKFQSNNESYVHLYSQCTKPSALYDKGAITIFGVNLTPREVTANLKGLKIKTLHKYILSPDSKTGNKMFSEKVLLNNKPLDLINDKKLPNLNPEIIINHPDGFELKLSPGNIGFWVIPNAKVKACVYPEEETTENITGKKLSKRHKNIIQQDNEEQKINDINNYQHSVQGSGRMKRDIGQKLVEIGLRKDNVFKKHSRIDNVKDYINERKTKRIKDDSRRDELLIPFNPRTTDSDENNFYGFFRRDPIKGFPESDIFITTGDSSEQNNKDYDYVQDESNENGSKVKNMQRRKELTQDHIEDNTWIEMENDYVPNEFFEDIKVLNARIKENPKNYSDLWEAEFSSQEHENNKNNNRIAVVKVFQEPRNEREKKRAIEKSVQKLVNYYDSKEQEHDRDTNYEALALALRRSSMPLSQLVKTPTYINHQASNMKPEEAKLKVESELKASSFFYQPSQTATVNYNYNNYHAKNTRHEETKLNKEEVLDVNISNDRDNINTETIKFSRPADVNTEYSIREMQYPILHNRRAKRSNWAKIQKILANEMIKENEENSKNCHCRIIRASHSSKKPCYCRVKRDSEIFADSSSEIGSVNVGSAQSKRNVENSMTKEEYEKIMAGEILPSTSSIESDYEERDYQEHDTTTETITTESSTLDYKSRYVTQTTDVSSTSIMDNSEINNISEQYHNVNNSNMKRLLVNSEFSPINEEDSNNNDIVNTDITKEMFFRSKPSDVQSENKTTTYGPSQIVSKIYSTTRSNRQELIASATENVQETTREETQNLIKKENPDSSTYSTITENQKDEEWCDNNDKIRLRKSPNTLETTERIAEEQITTEAILSKQATQYRATDNSRSNKSKTKLKVNVQQNVEDNENIESGAWTQSKKNIDTKKLKTILRKALLRGHEEDSNRRAEQMDKLKKRLAKRKKLLQQYRYELTKIADAEKRNLKRRETWERFCENDDFRHLIDQGKFIGVLIDDDVIYKDNNNEKYEIPIEFVKEVKGVRYPKYNKYYQFPRRLKIIEDDGESPFISSDRKYNQYYEHLLKIIKDKQELAEASRFSDHEHNQDCRCSVQMIEDEQESEETSKYDDRRIFAIDPSTYRGDEPTLQLHEKHSKLPKYYPKIKLENQNSILRRMLEKNYQENKKFVNYHDERENILNVEKIEDTKDAEKIMIPKNIDTDKEEMLNIRRFNGITESEYRTEHLDNKRENLAKDVYKIAKDTQEINKSYNSNEEIQNNINIEMSNNNKANKDVEKIINNDSGLSKLGKGNARTKRDINTQKRDKYLEQLLYFL